MSGVLSVRLHEPLDHFDLDLDVETRARVTGVFGRSGAGKTTLLKAIAGLRRRAHGVVRLDDDVWLDSARGVYLPPERRDVGYVPQEGLLFPHRDVRGNLLAGADRARRRGVAVDALFDSVCELLRLAPLLGRAVGTLSGGERQRVALGRAICSGPRLLLLDEPLASLDLPLRRSVLPYLRRVRDELDIPMLLVSHDPREMQALCGEVLVVERGRLVARGKPDEVLTDPRVFPLSLEDGFENVLAGTHAGNDAGEGILRLQGEDRALELRTPPLPGTPGGEVLVGLPAHDLLLADRAATGLSAQNVLPGTVERVESFEDLRLVLVRLAAGLPAVAVEVTARGCAELGVAPGKPVHVVAKARSCVVYGVAPSSAEPAGASGGASPGGVSAGRAPGPPTATR